ncbi:hypothetical protein [Leifsonia shinshuensis]|uniref:hypothetical protein n=1 Tax=Leifsonia shinshuensis TaxID=150026 RepID=UPI0028618B99|nr:hypothetical protein [Leifsonia shinshuensis]MDR6971704.1 hypothetical protein [Leifsonia shinshuensis]
MQASFVTSGEVPQIVADGTDYWVRLWTPPSDPQGGWFIDEWQISDATDALSVIEWARGRTAPQGAFEVFVESRDHAVRSDAQYVPVKRHIRIYGAPADHGGATEQVTFTAQ